MADWTIPFLVIKISARFGIASVPGALSDMPCDVTGRFSERPAVIEDLALHKLKPDVTGSSIRVLA